MKISALNDVIDMILENNQEVREFNLIMSFDDYIEIECENEYRGLKIEVNPLLVKHRMYLEKIK